MSPAIFPIIWVSRINNCLSFYSFTYVHAYCHLFHNIYYIALVVGSLIPFFCTWYKIGINNYHGWRCCRACFFRGACHVSLCLTLSCYLTSLSLICGCCCHLVLCVGEGWRGACHEKIKDRDFKIKYSTNYDLLKIQLYAWIYDNYYS